MSFGHVINTLHLVPEDFTVQGEYFTERQPIMIWKECSTPEEPSLRDSPLPVRSVSRRVRAQIQVFRFIFFPST